LTDWLRLERTYRLLWLVAVPLNGFVGALPIAEIVQVAVEQDAEFESAIQSISKELVVLNRKASLCANIEMKSQAESATRAKLKFDPDDSTKADQDKEVPFGNEIATAIKCFSVSELTKITGVGNDTLKKYGMSALGGRWIGRGKRGKQFTQSDAITIISAVNEGSTEVEVKKNAPLGSNRNPNRNPNQSENPN
jgi:hypothetical protein